MGGPSSRLFRFIGQLTIGDLIGGNAASDLQTGFIDDGRVVAVFSQRQFFHRIKQLGPFGRCPFFGDPVHRAIAGVIDQGRKQHRPTSRQRTPSPPQMQRRGMPITN